MQLTGALFLFLFFPLSFLAVLPVPARARPIAFTLLSTLWYVLANLQNPWGIATVAALVLFAVLLSRNPYLQGNRVFLTLGVGVPLSIFVTARILTEYTALSVSYPVGLGFLALGAISLFVDCYRGDAQNGSAVETCAYLLFFPALCMGPVLRWKQFCAAPRTLAFSLPTFCLGIRLYMSGFIKRLVAAAMLFRATEQILRFEQTALPIVSLLFLLPFAYFFFYFFVSSGSDLARGVAAMYGVETPTDFAMLSHTAPDRMLSGALLSLRAYLVDYVETPLVRICGRAGRFFAPVCSVSLTLLFFRTRLELLLFALPLLLSALLAPLSGKEEWRPRRRIWRLCLIALSSLLCSFLMLAMLFDTPAQSFSRFGAPLSESLHFFYYMFGSVSSTRYLLLGAILLALYLTIVHVGPLASQRMSNKTRTVLSVAEWSLIFAGFVIALLYFAPQFPHYANFAIPSLLT